MEAFAATLEELHQADLLLHVTDVSNPMVEDQIASVKKVLCILDLTRIPAILVLNKIDRLKGAQSTNLPKNLGGIPISALDRASLSGLRKEVEARIF